MGHSRPLFVYFCPFRITISIIQIVKSLDGVHGIQTHSRRMVGADKNHRAMAAAHDTFLISNIIFSKLKMTTLAG